MRWRSVVGVLMLIVSGCLPKVPVQRLPRPEKMLAAYVYDPETRREAQDVPLVLKSEIDTELLNRGFQPSNLEFDEVSRVFGSVYDSKLRFENLRKHAQGKSSYVMLVETRVSFFSQLNGRYRYNVYVRVTGGKTSGGEPSILNFDVPTYTNFDNERELQALEAARSQIAIRVGQLLDSLLLAQAQLQNGAPSESSVASSNGLGLPGPMYFVMVDRFWNGDSQNDGQVTPRDPSAFHGGDLQGVIDKLDDLHALGVRTIWLSPVFKMRTDTFFGHGAFHGYWVEDLTLVEPRFGTTQLLQKLAEELRRREMGLVLDMVFNHVAPDAPLLKEKPDWFHRKGPINDWNDVSQLTTHDVHGLPDLNQDNEEVYLHLMNASLKWVELLRPVGFRMDAVKHISLNFWARFNDELRAKVGYPLVIIGEMYDGSPVVQARIQREGRFDSLFDFPLYFALVDVFCRNQSVGKLASIVSLDRVYPAADKLVTFADNHDLPRILSDCEGKTDRVASLLKLQLLARGTPNLTYGTELGLEGKGEPHNRGNWRPGTSHFFHRQIAQLLALRAEHASLREGSMWVESTGQDWVLFGKAYADEVSWIAVNSSEKTVSIPKPAGIEQLPAHDVLANRLAGRAGFTVPPKEVKVYVTKTDSSHWRDHSSRRSRGLEKRRVQFQTKEWAIVGAPPELGAWNPTNALRTNEQGVAEVEIPVGSVIEFKLLRKDSSEKNEFEPGANRFLFVPEGKDVLTEMLSWNTK